MFRSVFGSVCTDPTTGGHVYGRVFHVGVEAARIIDLIACTHPTHHLAAAHHPIQNLKAHYVAQHHLAASLLEA